MTGAGEAGTGDAGGQPGPRPGRGTLVVLEGGEASGKSTQARLLAERLDAVLTREPGGTALGERVRVLLLDPAVGPLDAHAEALLVAAARAEHVAQVLEPALGAGRTVVSDRFTASSLAYQGYGRGLDVSHVECLNRWATGGLAPDLVVLLDVPGDESRSRLRSSGRTLDRLESEEAEFHERVATGFRALARAEPSRWVIVDGVGTVEEVAARVWAAYQTWEMGGGRS